MTTTRTDAHQPAVIKAQPAVPCPEGRVTIQGQVKSLKYRSNAYGGVMKILVQTDEGYKIWGERPYNIPNVQQGDIVRFSAIIKPTTTDPAFGFFSWPNHEVILTPAAP